MKFRKKDEAEPARVPGTFNPLNRRTLDQAPIEVKTDMVVDGFHAYLKGGSDQVEPFGFYFEEGPRSGVVIGERTFAEAIQARLAEEYDEVELRGNHMCYAVLIPATVNAAR